MRIVIFFLVFMLLGMGAEALTLPVWMQASIDEEGKPRLYLRLGIGSHFEFRASYSENRQFLRSELKLGAVRIWFEEPDERYGVRISKRWDKLYLGAGWRDDGRSTLYTSYRLSHQWKIGLSGFSCKNNLTGRVFLSFGTDLANYFPGDWMKEKEPEIEWEEFSDLG